VHGNVARIVSSLSHPGRDRGAATTDRVAPVSEPIVPPLAWMEIVPSPGDSWGPDAASSPLTYWHWRELIRVADQDRSRPAVPKGAPTLSVVVVVGSVPLEHLAQCVESVMDQTYPDWELRLCIEGPGRSLVEHPVTGWARSDTRIWTIGVDPGTGTAGALNHALDRVTGQFVVRLDAGDVLDREALGEIATALADDDAVDVLYSDEDRFTDIDRPVQPHFKPEWDPDLLLSSGYLGHVLVVRTELLRAIGGFRPEFDGDQGFDVMLRATERARRVDHIPRVLYHRRIAGGPTPYGTERSEGEDDIGRRVLESAIARRGIDGWVERGPFSGSHHVRWQVMGSPTVTVIIPFRDQAALTVQCLDSLMMAPGHPIEEFVMIDNGSVEPETRALRRRLEDTEGIRILDFPEPFNWAAINNVAAATCESDLLLFMNNDIEATTAEWLRPLVELAQRPEIGGVAPRLIYPDGKVQHAGVVLGLGGIGMNLFSGLPGGRIGYFGWDRLVRSYSALTGACLLVRRQVFEEIGGFEESLPVAFNDIDLCIRLGLAGYRLLYTPHSELTHYESVSRGRSGFTRDFGTFLNRWWPRLQQDDPAYNPNLGRFAPWCPLRMPGENERWLAEAGPAVPNLAKG
jgi:GT2 family glycosyltransferase